MKMVVGSRLVGVINFWRTLLGLDPILAIMLYPYVFFKDREPDRRVKNHEFVHILQIKKFGVWGFYSSYLWQFAKNLLRYRNIDQAYRNIGFEKEAYRLEHGLFIYLEDIRGE